MRRSTAKILQVVNLIGMFILMLLFHESGEGSMILIALVAIGISIWLSYCLRCPHCGAWPRKGSFFDQYCPRCGNSLDE